MKVREKTQLPELLPISTTRTSLGILPNSSTDMKHVSRVVFLSLLAMMIHSTAAAQTPVGEWRTIHDQTGEAVSIIEIYDEDGVLYGKVKEILIARDDAPLNDEGEIICEHCEGERHGQPIKGMVILEGFERDGDRWTGGRILDPETGRTYRSRIEMDGDKLRVRGYVGIPAFGRTQVWHPADDQSG